MPEDEKKRPRPIVEELTPPEKKEITPPENPPEDVEKNAKETLKELHELSNNKKPKSKTNYKLIFFVTVITALVVSFISGGLYVYFTGTGALGEIPSDKAPESTPTPPPPSPIATPIATAAPEEEIDYSAYKISVLNGSGKIGEAGKVENILEAEGFVVSSTANASRFDYTDTVIQSKKTVPQMVLTKLQSTLQNNYSVKSGDQLADNAAHDIVITVGSKVAQ